VENVGPRPNITQSEYQTYFQRLSIINVILLATTITFSFVTVILRIMKNDYWNSFYLKIASGMMVCWSAMMCFYIPFFFTIKDVRNYGFARGAKMYGVDSVINKITFFENSTENFDCRANFPEKTLVFPAGPNKKRKKWDNFLPKGRPCGRLLSVIYRIVKIT
jgi:hypothetical protein